VREDEWNTGQETVYLTGLHMEGVYIGHNVQSGHLWAGTVMELCERKIFDST
jgi:hypothetical protein